MAYASHADIEARWRELSATEEAQADTLCADASAIIDSLVTVGDDKLELAKVVVCNMVIRAMSAAQSDNFGLSQGSMTAGVYTQSWSYANPSGDMYLTKLDKQMLGITRGYIGSIPPKITFAGCGCDD